MKMKQALFLLLLTPLLYSQEVLTPYLLVEKLSEHNPQWQIGEYNLKKEYLDGERRAMIYEPFLNLAMAPAYTLSNNKFLNSLGQTSSSLTQSTGLNLSLGWRVPSQGTLSLSAADTLSIYSSHGESYLSQNPQLSLSFKQPILVNGKLIEGRAYEAEKQRNVTIPRTQAELNHRKEINTLISTKLTEYYNLLILNENYMLNIEETELARQELNQLSTLKDKGLFSGNDYWKKQLDMEKAEDALLEMEYQLKSAREKLSRSLGESADTLTLPLLEIDSTMIPLPPTEELLSLVDRNGDLESLRLLWEMDRLAWEGGASQKASDLSLSLTVSPQYSPDNPGAETLADSFSDFTAPDSWIKTSLSLSLSFSPSDWAANKLQAERDELASRVSQMNWENYRQKIEEDLKGLLEKDDMLMKKLSRIEESIGYQELLLEKERKLLALSSSTPLAVERARLNRSSRLLDKKVTLVEFSQNRLAILQLAGYDISTLDFRKLPGGTE
jgi:hypothetical protein